ncbi:MAG: hypothetical protein ABIO45_18420 [Burkholderiaceae bacterium]
MNLVQRMGAHNDAASARKAVNYVSGGAVLALAVVAMASAMAILRPGDSDRQPVPVSSELARPGPISSLPVSSQVPGQQLPSESDLLLQSYAPHGG